MSLPCVRVQPVTVAAIMTTAPFSTLNPDDALERAAMEMIRAEVRHLAIVDRGGRLVGVLSEGDVAAAAPDYHGRVRDAMATDLCTVGPETAAHEAAYLLLRHSIGCLPVTDGAGHLVGMLTTTDFVRAAHVLLGGRVAAEELEREETEAERVG